MVLLLLKDDAEIISKALKISLTAAGVPASASAGSRTTAADVVAELLELAEELVNQAGDATSPDEVAARWEDTSARRSLSWAASPSRMAPTPWSTTSSAATLALANCARARAACSRRSSPICTAT